jgi:hypothetical protein
MAGVDFSASYQSVEGLEAVTYFQKATEGTFFPVLGTPFTHAKRRAPKKADALGPRGGLLTGITLYWHVWTVDLNSVMPNIVPKAGDVLQDASAQRWTVVELEVQCQAHRYRLKTYRER